MTDVVANLDDLGRPAWIALMVVAFVLFWPIGLAILAYLIWSGRMGCSRTSAWGHDPRERWQRQMTRLQEKMDRWQAGDGGGFRRPAGFAPSGNRAFDEYREEMLTRLEQEAQDFKSFLDRLRHAKDKAEFDQFMADRRNRPADNGGGSVPDAGNGANVR